MNQLTAILKQHTPMIHFQHNESGATLRASEVKPLLDKFILTKLGNGDIREGRLYAKKNNYTIPPCFLRVYIQHYSCTIHPPIQCRDKYNYRKWRIYSFLFNE